jgi:hypothetical protein
MLHWSVTDEPAAQDPQIAEPARATGQGCTVESRRRRWHLERVVEIFARFFVHEPKLTAELLQELGRCDTSALAKLFGSPSPATDMSVAYDPAPVDTSPAEVVQQLRENDDVELAAGLPAGRGQMKPGVELPGLMQANPPPPVWDANGYRISPIPRLVQRHRSSHWSR